MGHHRTLLYGGGVARQAYATAFTAVTGLAWRSVLVAAGRTDLDVAPEPFGRHGIADARPYLDAFFDRYAAEVRARRHLFREQGGLLPGVPEVLKALRVLGG